MNKVDIKFMGHCTILIKTDTVNFILDPNFASKLFYLRRLDKPVLDTESFHDVNAILISNAHHHRLHPSSFKHFKQTAQMILPLGLGKFVNTYFNFRLTELKAGAQTTLADWKIIAIKSLHKGFRKCLFSRKKSLNYILKSQDKTIFYCSDTKYDGAYFFDIGKEYNIDLAILPIDHVGPDFLARKRYKSISNALQACQDLGAKKMLPYCFGSFNFSGRKAKSVLKKLKKETELTGIDERVHVLNPGEILSL